MKFKFVNGKGKEIIGDFVRFLEAAPPALPEQVMLKVPGLSGNFTVRVDRVELCQQQPNGSISNESE